MLKQVKTLQAFEIGVEQRLQIALFNGHEHK